MGIHTHAREWDYENDGRTKQTFKDETDINKIIRKAQKAGTVSHLIKHGAHYGDYADVPTLLEAHERISAGQAIFDELPSELRQEFGGSQFEFFKFVNDPANVDRLQEVLPGLAAPGRQLPAVRRSASTEANPALANAETPPAATDAVSAPPDPTPQPTGGDGDSQ